MSSYVSYLSPKPCLPVESGWIEAKDAYHPPIHAHMRQLEVDMNVNVDYMPFQKNINAKMRAILVDWMLDVCKEYSFSLETFHLAVHYTDRFLSRNVVCREKLQLVGATCLFTAQKYEEKVWQRIPEFVYMCADTYTTEEFCKMEGDILQTLEFKLQFPTSRCFYDWYFADIMREYKDLTMDTHVTLYHLGHYYLCLALEDISINKWLPSAVASAAILLARIQINDGSSVFSTLWTQNMTDVTGYEVATVRACAVHLHGLVRKQLTEKLLHAARDLFGTTAKLEVSAMETVQVIPHFQEIKYPWHTVKRRRLSMPEQAPQAVDA